MNLTFHLFFDLRNELKPPFIEEFKEFLRDIAFIPKELAIQPFGHVRDRLAIIHVARCDVNGEEFSLLIPYVRFQQESVQETPLLVDTNIIIDGRIPRICETGFLSGAIKSFSNPYPTANISGSTMTRIARYPPK